MNAIGSVINTLEADDPEFALVKKECEGLALNLFMNVNFQEKEWSEYLFKDGSMIGLNKKIADSYIDYISNLRMQAVGLTPLFTLETQGNPIPWVDNWIESDNVQVAPMETEITSYLVGQIDAFMDIDSFSDFEL